jgi:hypothetical protein
MADLKVGDTVWRHVERHYRPDGYDPRDDFHPCVIVGETRVSWLLKEGWREFRFPKKKNPEESNKDPDTRLARSVRDNVARIYLTQRAVDDEVWLLKNRWPLRKHLEDLAGVRGTAEELRKVAAMVGYKDKP